MSTHYLEPRVSTFSRWCMHMIDFVHAWRTLRNDHFSVRFQRSAQHTCTVQFLVCTQQLTIDEQVSKESMRCLRYINVDLLGRIADQAALRRHRPSRAAG